MSPNAEKNTIKIVYLAVVMLTGMAIANWHNPEASGVPLAIWIVGWIFEYQLFSQTFLSDNRDLFARIVGIGLFILGLAVWPQLFFKYPAWLSNPLLRAGYGLIVFTAQISVTYLLSSNEYRKQMRPLLSRTNPSAELKRLLLVVIGVTGAIILSGAVISLWAVSLGDSVRYVSLLWVTIWLFELILLVRSLPSLLRDWMAHLCGVGIVLVLTGTWIVLTAYYPWMLHSNTQLASGILTILSQAGSIYLVSSPEYREVFRFRK